MDISRHTGESRHRLALASCSDQDYLVVRVILDLIDLHKSLVRDPQITQFRRGTDDVYHTASFYGYFSSVFIGRIDDLLDSVHIGSKGSDNDPVIPVFGKNIVKSLAHGPLRHGKPFSFCIGTVAHQGQHTLLADLRKSLEINGISEYRSIIHLKIPCMDHCSRRGIDRQGRSVLNTVVRLDEFDPEAAQINRLSVLDHFSLGSSQ